MDAIVWVDRESGWTNRVSMKELARKEFGLMKAFTCVEKELDWKKPKTGDKSWKSKVDWEAFRRTDPGMSKDEVMKISRVDEEQKKEMERDALILKTKQKLEASGGNTGFEVGTLSYGVLISYRFVGHPATDTVAGKL